jgi:uncharacterized DUF497 family protein
MRTISGIRWTEEAIEHIFRHRISPVEVEEACFGPDCLIRTGKDGLHYVFGQTGGGRFLFVVVRDIRRGEVKIITAREMNPWEKKYFIRKGK